nr:hypothetical protein [Tanacetum cinerariifolium]
MMETMEEYMSKTRRNYGSGFDMPRIGDKTHFVLKGLLKELRENTFINSEHEDTNEHIEKVLKIVGLFHIPETSNTLPIMDAGGKDHPPMLAPGNYVLWKSRIKRYIDSKPNHELIHYCLKNPPYKYIWADKIVLVSEGIDNDIYSIVDACPNACEMWKAVERFYKMMNELVRNQCDVTNHQVNVQFLLQLQPKWQRSQQATTRNRVKAIVNSLPPIYDQEPFMVAEDDEVSKDKETDKLMALISLSFKKIYKPTNNNLRTSSNTSRANQDNSLRINRGTGRVARECQKPKRAKDAAYHREKILLYAADNSRPIFDYEPLQKVSNDDNYNVFAIENEHPEQSKSVHDTYSIEQDEHNVIIDSLDMSYDREHLDHDDDDDLANEYELLASLIEKLKCKIDDSKNRNKFLKTSNKVLVDKLKGEIGDFKTKNKSLESSNNRFKEANNKLSKTNELMYNDLKKFQAELDGRNDVKYASKMEINCAKAKEDLMSYKIKSKKSFNAYTQKINDLNQMISKMKKELFAHQETISILSQAKEAQIKLYKTREDKELDEVITLENKVKVLDNIVYKTGQSVQTMNMLNRNCKTSFTKPKFFKKAQRANPRLYDIGCYNDNHALMLAPESDEVIRLEKETRSKLSDLIRPFDYEKLNNLYDLFVPQREKSSEQRYFLERSKMSYKPVNNENSKESFNKQTTLLEKQMDESIPYDQKCKSSKELFKIKRSVGTIFDGVEHSLKSQLETQKTQFLNEIDRLSREYYYLDHMNAILGVYTELDEVKGIAISELKKLIEKLKGKYVNTKFEKSSVIRQPNAFKSQRPLILGKPTIFLDSLERKDFSKSKSVTKNNVSIDFSKPVTAQILPPNKKSILKNTNVLAPGMYKLHTEPTQTEQHSSSMVQKSGIQCYNCKEYGHVARECQKPKRAKDAAYHREKMLLCKQEEAGIQLNVEQADWRDDIDDESDDQESEAHYMYMAKLQQVSPDDVDSGPIFDKEPEQKVQNDDHYDVFAIDCQHSEQSESIHNTYLLEQDAQNVSIESVDMNYDSDQIDQNDEHVDLAKERELLASLIAKLKCEIDESKNRNTFLETSNKVLVEKLKSEIADFKNKNKSLTEANNKLSEVNAHLYADYKKSKEELKRRNTVGYASEIELECAKLRELKTRFAKPEYLKKAKQANPRLTKMPIVVPVSTREPKRSVKQSIAKPIRKTVASESNQKPRTPTRKLYEHVSKTCSWWYPKFTPSGYNWKPKSEIGNVNQNLVKIILFIVDCGCSEHMTRNIKLLINFVEKFLGTMKFGNDQIAPIFGYGDLNDIVVGLLKLKFVKDHLCSSCELGKAKRKSFQTKTTPSSKRRLQLLHMDLCGPMRVASINGKKYVLVIVDDYSRYTWTHFLRSKDETPKVLIDFLRLVQRGLHAQVRIVRTDKGTKLLNKTLHAYFASEGILHQTSIARTPEQNGVVERWNRTLVEVARIMLSAAKVSLFFWAKAIATTCFTQNRSLVIRRHEKTPYHVINDRKPSVKFFHIFGSLCYIVRDGENLDKIKETCDACILVGYSTQSRAYRVFNKRTRVIVETIHVNFDELPQMASYHVNKTVTTSNELDLLFSLMFDELLNGSSKVVSKYSIVTTANAPNKRQQQNTTPLNTQTTPEPTCHVPTQAPTVTSTENINQAEMVEENAQVENNEFINIFYTPVQDRGETSSRHVD